MCGIAGIISKEAANIQQLRKMTDAIAHRGPDGEGQWISHDGETGFGHRRLSIIDLSNNGHQPMTYADRYTITFNGEIYNYAELRAQLILKGYTFKSDTDTEVLLALYADKKEECLEYLQGMFAFAIYDAVEKKTFCARDRFGEKPFFFSYVKNKYFVFASEMKALWQYGIQKRVSQQMLFNHLLNIHQLSNPQKRSDTFYEEVHKLEPAHYLIIDKDLNIIKKRYWDLDLSIAKSLTEKQAIEDFSELFEGSLKLKLRADVPIGSSLSGGLDSSTIVCLIDKLNNANNITQKTFSARFKDFSKDEGFYMDRVISKTKAEAFFTWPDENEFINELDKIFYHQEEPFGSTSIFAQWSVMKLAKEKKVPVLIDGQGADEILAGYPYYYPTYLKSLAQKKSDIYLQELEAYRVFTQTEFKGFNYENETKLKLKQALRPLKKMFNSQNNKEGVFLHKDFRTQFSGKDKYNTEFSGDLKDQLYTSTCVYGLEDLLRFADRNSMAHSIEVRLPFLDHKLVEFCFALPDSYKLHNGWSKYILRKSFEESLPAEISWRKDKIGYASPQEKWFANPVLKDLSVEASVKLEKEKILDSGRDKNHDDPLLMITVSKLLSL